MTEPNEQDVKRFRAAVDHLLSGLEGDPRLAKKIINQEKEEKKMKKKMTAGLALAMTLVLLSVFALAEGIPTLTDFLDESGVTAHKDLIAKNPPREDGPKNENSSGEQTAEKPSSVNLPSVSPSPAFVTPQPIELALAAYADETQAPLFSPVNAYSTPQPADISQTAALHKWMYEKGLNGALTIEMLAKSDLYLKIVKYPESFLTTLKKIREQDFSAPLSMQIYALNEEALEEDISHDEARLYIYNRILQEATAALSSSAYNSIVSALRCQHVYRCPEMLENSAVISNIAVLNFNGDYSICSVFLKSEDSAVICDSSVMVYDLPSYFQKIASYEGIALELLSQSALANAGASALPYGEAESAVSFMTPIPLQLDEAQLQEEELKNFSFGQTAVISLPVMHYYQNPDGTKHNLKEKNGNAVLTFHGDTFLKALAESDEENLAWREGFISVQKTTVPKTAEIFWHQAPILNVSKKENGYQVILVGGVYEILYSGGIVHSEAAVTKAPDGNFSYDQTNEALITEQHESSKVFTGNLSFFVPFQ